MTSNWYTITINHDPNNDEEGWEASAWIGGEKEASLHWVSPDVHTLFAAIARDLATESATS